MSLNSENLYQNRSPKRSPQQQTPAEDLFVKPSWLRLDSIVTALLDIEGESEKHRVAMRNDMRLVAFAGVAIEWDRPENRPYKEAKQVLGDLSNRCR